MSPVSFCECGKNFFRFFFSMQRTSVFCAVSPPKIFCYQIRNLQIVAFESLKELLLSEEKNLGKYAYIYSQLIMYDAQCLHCSFV